MVRNSVRRMSAFLLVLTMWLSLTAFYPVSVAAQDKSNKTSSKKQQNKKDSKKKDDKKDQKPNQQTSSAKSLSDDEDPAMIGKRNINGGSDKFFGWLGGSRDKEIAIGRQLSLEVEQQAKLVEDPLITEYVNRVGQNIVLHSDAKIPFTIKVIDSDEVNAFALPGGYFYVNKGLILAADNEAELAGVMAHEIAHVAARHAMENNGKMTAIQYGLLGTIIFGGGIASTIAQNAGGLGQMLSFFQFSRGAEGEADKLGVQYLYASGYDPTAMASMFEKLSAKNKKKPGTLAKLFTTHPQSEDRRDSSQALVARFPEREEYVISTSEFQRVKGHLMKMTNAKATVGIDVDEGGESRPTLKRRSPEQDATTPGTSESDTKDAPPQLKKRGSDPETKPSPNP